MAGFWLSASRVPASPSPTVTINAATTTPAQFIQRFVNSKPWAHLDIAGTAWSTKDTAIAPKGATAFGVRLLDRLVASNYEA